MAKQQRGFSLVELMIAMALGLVIVAAAIQLFTTNQRTFRLQMDVTEVQEQGRFAMDYLSRNILNFGRRERDAVGLAIGDPAILDETLSKEGGAGATANDVLAYSFFGTEDCEGDVNALGEMITNEIWVDNEELICRGSISAGTNGVAVAGGIESFQVLYGVDVTAGEEVFSGEGSATAYYNADSLALGVSDVVTAIRIGLLVRVENSPQADTGQVPPSFIVLDKALQGGAAPLDTPGIRRLFVSTIKIRNFNGTAI